MGVASGHLHKGGAPAFVETIMVDEEAEDIAKTYANMYQTCVDLYISAYFANSLTFCFHPIHPRPMHKPATRQSMAQYG